jgi:hypothetical protein
MEDVRFSCSNQEQQLDNELFRAGPSVASSEDSSEEWNSLEAPFSRLPEEWMMGGLVLIIQGIRIPIILFFLR